MVQTEQLSRHQSAARLSSPQEGIGRTEVRAVAAVLHDVADGKADSKDKGEQAFREHI